MQQNNATYNTEICASGDTAELAKIRAFVEERALKFGFSEADVIKITLAVDEACSNLVRHAYKHDKSEQFCVRVETKGDQFIVSILDNGPTFNPLQVASPDMKEYFKKAQARRPWRADHAHGDGRAELHSRLTDAAAECIAVSEKPSIIFF